MHAHPPSAQTESKTSPEIRQTRRYRWVFGVFVAMAALLLGFEHRAHLLGILPWLFLLACPLMHLFMHHDHGSHGDHHGESNDGGTK